MVSVLPSSETSYLPQPAIWPSFFATVSRTCEPRHVANSTYPLRSSEACSLPSTRIVFLPCSSRPEASTTISIMVTVSPTTSTCSVALWNWLTGCRLDFDRLAVHVPTNGFVTLGWESTGVGRGSDSTYILSFGQLAKPYSRASACWASASFEAGFRCFKPCNRPFACFLRCSRFGWGGKLRDMTTPL